MRVIRTDMHRTVWEEPDSDSWHAAVPPVSDSVAATGPASGKEKDCFFVLKEFCGDIELEI